MHTKISKINDSAKSLASKHSLACDLSSLVIPRFNIAGKFACAVLAALDIGTSSVSASEIQTINANRIESTLKDLKSEITIQPATYITLKPYSQLIASFLGTAAIVNTLLWLRRIRKWGTQSNPKFKAVECGQFREYDSLNKSLKEQLKSARKSEETFKDLLEKLSRLEDRIKKNMGTLKREGKAALQHPEIATIHAELNDLEQGYFPKNPRYAEVIVRSFSEVSQPYIEKFGDPIELAKRLFKNVTKQDFPDNVKIRVKPILKLLKAAGYANLATDKVRVDPDCYYNMVHVAAHEFGHIISPYGASNYLLIPFPFFSPHNVRVRTEAVAVAFAIASCLTIEDENLADFSLIHSSANVALQEFLNKEDDFACHSESNVVADAAITVFKSPAIAYNHLSEAEELDPRIKLVIDENIELAGQLKAKSREWIRQLNSFTEDAKKLHQTFFELLV